MQSDAMLSSRNLSTSEPQDEPAERTVTSDDADHDAHPLAGVADVVAVVVKDSLAVDEALVGEISLVHAVAFLLIVPSRRACEGAGAEFVDHHSLENVGLVIDVVEDVAPEGVQRLGWHEEASSAHPQAVGEGGGGQGDDEDGHDGADQHDERLGGQQVEEQPHDPSEEGIGCGAEVG